MLNDNERSITFSAYLKNCHGQYTEMQISRCSKIVGGIGKAIEDIFQNDVIQDYIPNAAATDGSSKSKIKKFVEEYRHEDLFKDKGERHHHGFENFKHEISVNNPEKLNARLKKYVKALENEEFLYE